MSVKQILLAPNRLMDRFADQQLAADRSIVEDPNRYRRVKIWAVVRYVLFLLATVVLLAGVGPIAPWAMPAWIFFLWYTIRGTQVTRQAAKSYHSGWLQGRTEMILSMDEAGRRDMDHDEWLQGELERTDVTMMTAYGMPRILIHRSEDPG